MKPELEAALRAIERDGRRLDDDGLRVIRRLYAALDLDPVTTLLIGSLAEQNATRRLKRLPDLLAAFDRATGELVTPPSGIDALLQRATRLGLTGTRDLIMARSSASYELDPAREREYFGHAVARWEQWWPLEPPRFRADMQRVFLDALERQYSPEEATALMRARLDVSRSRAAFIVRNEIGNAQAYAAQQEQQEAGFDAYRWSTANDSRVRPQHQRREGKLYRWNDPPGDGHPGEAFLCRCVAIPGDAPLD